MVPNPISISNDIALQIYPPLTCIHEYFGVIPPAPAPAYLKWGIAAEIPVPMFWPPGFAMGQNSLTTTVLHKGMAIVQDGHDCGALIVHVQIVPNPANTLTAIHIPFSSRKTNFFSSTVLSQGKCTAAATLVSWPPAPMTSCWDPVSPPLSGAPTSHLNSVVFTMSFLDMVLAWGIVIASMALDFLLDKYRGSADPSGSRLQVFGTELLKKFVPTNQRAAGNWAIKQAFGVLTGAARLGLTDGPAGVGVSIGSPFLNAGVGISRNAEGNYSGSASARSMNRSGQASYDGQVTTQREQGGLGGPQPTTSQSTSGGQTTRSETSHSWNPTRWGAPL